MHTDSAAACCLALVIAATLLPAANAADFRMQSLKEIRERAVVIQQWDNTCAAAALATVLTYHFQDPVTERNVAAKMLEQTEAAKVRARGGFSLLDMKRFVEGHGYTGAAYQNLSSEDLKLFPAAIVPINPYGADHYVVLNEIRGDQVHLADPAYGNRTMSLDAFKKVWMDGLVFVINKN
jgi:hypothetical protein